MVSQSSVVHVVWSLSAGTLGLSENQTGQGPQEKERGERRRGKGGGEGMGEGMGDGRGDTEGG